MLIIAGCSGVNSLSRATVKGQDICVGMSLQKLDSLLGAPDPSKMSDMINTYTRQHTFNTNLFYDKYQISIKDGVVDGIYPRNKRPDVN